MIGNSRTIQNSGGIQDFDQSRAERTLIFPDTSYNPPEDSSSQDAIATVEKNMKKYVDNLMRFLEGISSKLSQLELHYYNLDQSIGEMKSELNFNLGEQYSKLKSLEKHLQEIHSSEQVLRVKPQLAQKESSSLRHSLSNEDRSPSTKYAKKTDNASDAPNRWISFTPPHQIAPQPQPTTAPPQAPTPYVTQATQQPAFYPLPGMQSLKKTAPDMRRGAGGPVSHPNSKYTPYKFLAY
ncbi:transcription factor CAULIFLOWER-like isoform X2 [Lotus japonicus]|uniref:transcription factor CAULIFLOWER-like isoform X2 n=1 Tax=Lotus japonicus TaxID=34305 RepID=UPI00258342B8|nr:transcription factor CAULIFLOWER-like isoform X2 [Lotus japonicus]